MPAHYPDPQHGGAAYPGAPYPAGPQSAGPQPPAPGSGYGAAPPPAGYPTGPQPGPYPGGYPTGQQPAGPYPTGPQPYPGGYPTGQQPAGQYPTGPQPPAPGSGYGAPPPPAGYPTGPQPGSYPTGPQPPGPYQPGYPSGAQPAGPYPTGGYPQQPGGWPAVPGGQYPTGPLPAGAPQPGYGQPGQPDYLFTGYGTTPPPPPRRRRRTLWAVIATGTAVALTAGGVTAYSLLAGGGVALDARVPGDAAAYAEVNFDPPAGQKVATLRFLRHFPDVKVREDAGDLVEGLIEPLIESPKDRRTFTESIKPWLGNHAAFAADPQGSKTQPIFLVESTNDGLARDGLDRLRREAGAEDDAEPFGYVVKDKVVVIAETEAIAQRAVDEAATSSLRENKTFRDDIKAIGDEGVLTAWADLGRLKELTDLADTVGGVDSDDVDLDAAGVRGRLMASLRFTDSSVDLVVRGVGQQSAGLGEAVGSRLATLPEDTVVAVALSGGDQVVRQAYDQARKAGLDDELTDLEQETGLDLPDDVAALVGTSTVVAVGGTSDDPQVGMVSKTGDVTRAKTAAERLLAKLEAGDQVTIRSVGDGTVIANSPEYADKLTASGTLGNSERFKDALPDLKDAQFVLYVDLQRAMELADERPSPSTAALRAFGLTASQQGDVATTHLRLTVG